ncbi:protein MODIFIER OF SNC1 1-like [Telopea speciosissima]|uniref:protein MODIFIER OF SNC1 1-like n=1 Tax=Telopea speciosissima TaxID=54955 RepID=UPI001CC6A5B8|nr:protein MODIFIER OF SNC1 1-like [Telopea speciosissima]XP_043705780.1 protein MODIFIER OF SNC1 1-like [Telopea speciosissima]
MSSGERRWVSARRGGMTVLGKVAVPKPVNLPSQRLENHGLDPNVEIVPKGTLSWGSCSSSSSAPNAWGSSASPLLSSDGVAGSPSRLNGRPSSGGSGSRPSTAGSDRSYESAPNAWGPNSRPSSSSGVLSSNQTSMVTTRPRSAETRPGSSQLSRFAELSENSVAWGALGTAEKLGATSSKVNNFTLSSGDFPTLGSDKNSESPGRQGHSSQGCPVSASGRVSTSKESSGTSPADHEHVDANAEGETVNTWTGDKSSYVVDGASPSMENWHRDPQPFPNTNMPPQHLEPWHATPVRLSSDGVWFRGPPGGPPYGTPGPPGSYPLEPFNYYHPQGPPRPLPNSQPVPRPGSGPSSYHHQKNADSYRPQIPESYLRPMMPMRPGVYPGMVPYDGYYGPPQMAMCNSSDRDAPVLGMAAGPCVYNRYPNQNLHHDTGNFHARSAGYGSASTTMVKEQVEHSHSHDIQRGPYKVLLKQQDDWEEKDGEENRGHAISTNATLEGGQQPRTSGENDSVTGCRKYKAVDLPKKAFGGEAFPQPTDDREGSSVSGSMSNAKTVNDTSVKKGEPTPTPGGPKQFTATKRNPSLIDKIEGLNTRARTSDGRNDCDSISSIDEKMKRSRFVSANVDHSMNENETLSGAASAEKTYKMGRPILSSQESGTYTRDKTLEQKTFNGTAVVLPVSESQASAGNVLNAPVVGQKNHDQFHKRLQGAEVRVDNQVKGRFTQDGEEWRKKPPVAKSSTVIPAANMETSDVNVQVFHAPQEASEKSDSTIHGRTGGEYGTSSFEPNNYNAQRAKRKEKATQHAKQLQTVEEELNRRTQAENSSRKLENCVSASGSIQQKREDPRSHVDNGNSRPAHDTADGGNSSAVAQGTDRLGESSNLSKDLPLEASKCEPQDSVELHNLSVPLQQDVNNADAANPKSAQPAQVQENISSRQRPMGHRKKLNIPSDKNLSERPTLTGSNGASKSHVNVVPDVKAPSGDSGMPNNACSVDDPLPPQKRKTQRNGRSKHKLDETLSGTLPLSTSTEEKPVKVRVESAKAKASEVVLEVSSVHVMNSRESVEVQDCQSVPSADQGWSLSTEVANSRANNQWRPQPRRMPQNQQATRSADKFHAGEAVVWAPVRSQNKNEELEGASRCTTPEANASYTKNGQGMESNMTRGKRAEMERYVPKPVAKEMLQQGNTERPSPKINQSICDKAPQKVKSGSEITESGGLDGLATGKSGTVVVPKNVGSKHNTHGKAHGSWCQRGLTEPPPVQGLQEGSALSLGTSKSAYKPIEPPQPQKTETYSSKGPEKYSDNWTSNNPVSTDPVTTDVKNNSLTGRGKRHPFKGHKGTEHNFVDQKHVHGTDKIDAQTSALELNQPEGGVALRENYVGEHSTSHWQPKSQPHVAHNQRANRGNGGQKFTAHVSRNSEKEFTQHADGRTSQNKNKDHGPFPDQPQPQPHQSEMSKTNVSEGSTVRSHEAKKEKKGVDSFKQHAVSPNQDPVNNSEISPANIDTQHEQQFSSGFRRHVHHNGCFNRVQESPHAGHNPARQDSSKQNHVPGNGERKRQNSHYEYQAVGSHNNKPEDSSEGSRVMGSRYRERGQNHSRRGGGNFYARSNDSIRVTAGYGIGE